MENEYSVEDLLDFLTHASERGLMPAASATALAVGVRNVLGVLDPDERTDLRTIDLDSVIKRFNNKRARDFNPASLKVYAQRTRRAIDDYLRWRDDPASFSIKTRATTAPKREKRNNGTDNQPASASSRDEQPVPGNAGGYQSAVPVRPGHVVTISNIPSDLTQAEAERLAQFIRLLATA